MNETDLYTCVLCYGWESFRQPYAYTNVRDLESIKKVAEKKNALYILVYSSASKKYIKTIILDQP